MNARIATSLVHPQSVAPTKTAAKHGASAFDHTLDKVKPKAHEASPQGSQQQPKHDQNQQAQQQPSRSEQDELRTARLLAALRGVPLTALVVPRAMDTVPIAASVEAIEGGATEPSQDESPTSPGIAPKTPEAHKGAIELDAGFELPEAPEEVPEDTLVEVTVPQIDPEQVAQLIASTHADKPVAETPHAAPLDATALEGETRTNVAEPTRAVEAAAPARPVEWTGMGDAIANGSIEGNRARVVIGQGAERIVLTVATHAHRVSLEVETSTPAGQQLAEQLRKGPPELRQALQQHGLDLADQRAPSQQHEPDEDVVRTSPTKQVTPTIVRPTGVVA